MNLSQWENEHIVCIAGRENDLEHMHWYLGQIIGTKSSKGGIVTQTLEIATDERKM